MHNAILCLHYRLSEKRLRHLGAGDTLGKRGQHSLR
jgi:hypothetical protein